jgi:aminobenzoyl-glutamate transport protein
MTTSNDTPTHSNTPNPSTPDPGGASPRSGLGLLNLIERVGNKIPDPTVLFVIGTFLIMLVSHIGVKAGWEVKPVQLREVTQPVLDAAGQPVLDSLGKPKVEPVIDPSTKRAKTELITAGEPIKPVSLLDSDGLYWVISNLVRNFINFPPLGIVLVGMLGVGVAEKVGLFDALLKAAARAVPMTLLTPTAVFLGLMSHIAGDAGYIVLPPLAAALFLAAGRSPLVGIAATFAGVAGGFSANLLISGTDALIAGITQSNAQILDPNYLVAATANWYFMAASTVLLTFLGWAVCAWIVEPRLAGRPADEGGALGLAASSRKTDAGRLSVDELRGLSWAGLSFALALGVVLAAILIEGAPLHGTGVTPGSTSTGARWVNSVVPIVFFLFLVPGIAYGAAVGKITGIKDLMAALVDSMKAMSSVIVMSFFAAQFIAAFGHSNLGRMLAIVGGIELAAADVHPMIIIVLFIMLVMLLNLLVSSMSAKYLLIAPIFVPMFMMLGISPELTQSAYRVADSVTNIITPMNSYLVIILAVAQRYSKTAGVGTLISMMLPFSVVFGIFWTIFLLIWIAMGWPLGPDAGLWYPPPAP